MNDADRRALFHSWFAGPPMRGDREALIRASGYTKGRISQFFDSDQQFGERAARSLAGRLGLPMEFFNTPASATPARELASPGSLADALRVIDQALDPLDSQARRIAAGLLVNLERPGNAPMVASLLFAATESAHSKRLAA